MNKQTKDFLYKFNNDINELDISRSKLYGILDLRKFKNLIKIIYFANNFEKNYKYIRKCYLFGLS
jgi:hypothetical protein